MEKKDLLSIYNNTFLNYEKIEGDKDLFLSGYLLKIKKNYLNNKYLIKATFLIDIDSLKKDYSFLLDTIACRINVLTEQKYKVFIDKEKIKKNFILFFLSEMSNDKDFDFTMINDKEKETLKIRFYVINLSKKQIFFENNDLKGKFISERFKILINYFDNSEHSDKKIVEEEIVKLINVIINFD